MSLRIINTATTAAIVAYWPQMHLFIDGNGNLINTAGSIVATLQPPTSGFSIWFEALQDPSTMWLWAFWQANGVWPPLAWPMVYNESLQVVKNPGGNMGINRQWIMDFDQYGNKYFISPGQVGGTTDLQWITLNYHFLDNRGELNPINYRMPTTFFPALNVMSNGTIGFGVGNQAGFEAAAIISGTLYGYFFTYNPPLPLTIVSVPKALYERWLVHAWAFSIVRDDGLAPVCCGWGYRGDMIVEKGQLVYTFITNSGDLILVDNAYGRTVTIATGISSSESFFTYIRRFGATQLLILAAYNTAANTYIMATLNAYIYDFSSGDVTQVLSNVSLNTSVVSLSRYGYIPAGTSTFQLILPQTTYRISLTKQSSTVAIAQVFDENGNPVPDLPLNVYKCSGWAYGTLGGDRNTLLGTVTTNASGQATITYNGPLSLIHVEWASSSGYAYNYVVLGTPAMALRYGPSYWYI